jgi:signal transduction histidine kinase
MLYLQPAETTGRTPGPVPLAELTAIGFERALLAGDVITCKRELSAALARDPAVAEWAFHTARRLAGHEVRTLDDAIAWLAPRLPSELASALVFAAHDTGRSHVTQSEIELRLPALAKRLEAYEQRLADFNAQLEYEKLEAVKELAYGAGHEINNPLANIAARAQTLLADEADPERGRKLAAIHRQAMRAHEMIADLMLFSRPPKLNCAPCDLAQIARQVINQLSERAHEQGTQLSCDLGDEPLVLHADSTQLAVAIQAVVVNALEAVGEAGRVHIAVQRIESEGVPVGEITIRDDGPGISEEVRRRMFDPFFSGREAGRGLGFGLSKCWRIVTDHGGQVVVRQPRGGTEIAIVIPLAEPSATPAASSRRLLAS